MNKLILPPKRYESDADPKFDPIRFKPWFAKLASRRKKLEMLRMAYVLGSPLENTQKAAAEFFGVNERELRDYAKFKEGKGNQITATQQKIIDEGYQWYLIAQWVMPWRENLSLAANRWGINPRHILELWEVHPHYYPTGYEKIGT